MARTPTQRGKRKNWSTTTYDDEYELLKRFRNAVAYDKVMAEVALSRLEAYQKELKIQRYAEGL